MYHGCLAKSIYKIADKIIISEPIELVTTLIASFTQFRTILSPLLQEIHKTMLSSICCCDKKDKLGELSRHTSKLNKQRLGKALAFDV
ncbi:hypothetical protein OROMI_017772 [Orobanche minor]